MCSNMITEDLRSVKTEKALYGAVLSLLESHNFKKLTIRKICEKALISRAAFYAHFIDKYDMLKCFVAELWKKNFGGDNYIKRLERAFDRRMTRNLKIFKNLICDANNETYDILFNFIISLSMQGLSMQNEQHDKFIVFANFYAGGILSYFSWQIKNGFPADVQIINKYFREMVSELEILHYRKV